MPEVVPFASFDRKYEGIAKYPAVTRDISMVVPKAILAGDIEDVIETSVVARSWRAMNCSISTKVPRSKRVSNQSLIQLRSEQKTEHWKMAT